MWTKKLDEMHYHENGKTLCGRHCLGNNYANDFTLVEGKYISKWLPERTMCKKCASEKKKKN